ncbi:MAG: AraC family transcriptional regulator [Clostridia bacterium]|nr:AraC family transcriptional regulator [Clostridia bacterium]
MPNSFDHLFAAHHPDPSFLETQCLHYYNEVLSIAATGIQHGQKTISFHHAHCEYEFLIPYGPIPLLILDGKTYFGENGYVYPTNPLVIHGTKFQIANTPHDNIVIDQIFFDNLLARKGYSGWKFIGRIPLTEDIKTYLQHFKNEFIRDDFHDPDKLQALSYLLASSLAEAGLTYSRTRKDSAYTYQKGMAQIAAYISAHYTEPLTIDGLADMCGVTPTYFISSFKKTIGLSPHQYLSKLRLSNAKHLLETTDLSIQRIAYLCGFQRANTFASLFRSTYGQSPLQFRKEEE